MAASCSSPLLLLGEVVALLDTLFPRRLAAAWDNVGLLVAPLPPKRVATILLTNDLTRPVVAEAVARQADLIVSYHPPLFHPLKRLCAQTAAPPAGRAGADSGGAIDWKQHALVTCLERRIALYSPHTAADAVEGGVNDWLCQCLAPLAHVEALQPAAPPRAHSVTITVNMSQPPPHLPLTPPPPPTTTTASDDDNNHGAGGAGGGGWCNWLRQLQSVCADFGDSVTCEVVRQVVLDGNTAPAAAAAVDTNLSQQSPSQQQQQEPNLVARISFLSSATAFTDRHLTAVCQWLDSTGAIYTVKRLTPSSSPSAAAAAVEDDETLQLPRCCGAGRRVQLLRPLSLAELVARVKRHLGLTHVRLARGCVTPPPATTTTTAAAAVATAQSDWHNDMITSVAVCAGAGGSLLAPEGAASAAAAASPPADVLISGEMSHHQVLQAVHAGSHVLLCEHSNTERGYLTVLAQMLRTVLGDSGAVSVFVAQTDRDPLDIV